MKLKNTIVKNIPAKQVVLLTNKLDDERIPYKLILNDSKCERYDLTVDNRDGTKTIKFLAEIMAER